MTDSGAAAIAVLGVVFAAGLLVGWVIGKLQKWGD